MSERSQFCRHEALREECPVCKPFREASARRRENGIRLKRFAILADASQVEALDILWSSFLERWGKQQAVDNLIQILSTVESRQRDKENAQTNAQKGH